MILYLAIVGDGNGSSFGVINKIIGQVDSFQKITFTKCIIYYSKNKPLIEKKNNITVKSYYSRSKIYRRVKLIKSFNYYTNLYPNAKIFIRYPLTDFLFLAYLWMHKDREIYIERQTKELSEGLSTRSLSTILLSLCDYVLYTFPKFYIKGEIAVTDEVAQYIKKRRHDGKVYVITNGIESKKIDILAPPNISSIILCYIGNVTLWSGLDILLYELEKVSFLIDNKRVLLYIIGDGIFLAELKKIAKKIDGHDSIIFGGSLNGEQKEAILSKCNIGISSLRPQRRLLYQGSNLKNREYCLHGLPFIKADYDVDFDNREECTNYFRNIKKSSEIVPKIYELMNILEKDDNIKCRMNQYANDFLSWDSRISKYLEAMRIKYDI